jgi:hypothetical protein
MKKTSLAATVLGSSLAFALLPATVSGHHSYAMYDGSIYKVFTGVVVRIVPNAAHFEIHFVPLNDERNALVRDDEGEQLVWVVQMESAAEAFRHGITRESFPQGAVMSMGVHPRRDGKPAGDRGESGLFQCPKGKAPESGKHCDSVAGATAFGEGVLPPEGAVRKGS